MRASAKSTKTLRVVASSLEEAEDEKAQQMDLNTPGGNILDSFVNNTNSPRSELVRLKSGPLFNNEKKALDNTRIIQEIINQDVGGFIPEKLFEDLVKNFALAKNIYGEKLIRLVLGYDERYIEKNIHIPDFQKEIKRKLVEKIEELKEEKLVDDKNSITERGFKLASLILYLEELSRLSLRESSGEEMQKHNAFYGERSEPRPYRKGDKYRDIALRKSLKTAIKRNHEEILVQDLHTNLRENKGTAFIIYGLDASASMKGEKIDMCKKAGVALAYKAIGRKDNVGLVVFGSEVKDFIPPGDDFAYFVERIARIRASKQTNISAMTKKAVEMLPQKKATKHIILLTDALPTYGISPEEETLEAVSFARANGVTISVVGIGLDEKGRQFAKKMVLLGEGRLYLVENLDKLDLTVLEDYARVG